MFKFCLFVLLVNNCYAAITELPTNEETTLRSTISKNQQNIESDGSDQLSTALEITKNLPACQKEDPDLNKCLKHVIEAMVPVFRNGSKELNIPVLDPFTLNRTVFQYTNGGISGRILMRNGQVFGFANTKIKKLNIQIEGDNVKFRELVYLPKLRIEGNYKADININGLRVKPKGTYNVTLVDVDIDEVGDGKLYEKNNHRYLRLSKLDADPKVGNLQVQASGIFPDPNLDEIFMNITNQYWQDIYRIMLPETKRYWAPMLLQVVNEALSVVPFDLFVKEN